MEQIRDSARRSLFKICWLYADLIFYLVVAMVTVGGIHYKPNKNNCLDALPFKVSGWVKKTPKYIGIYCVFDLV